MQDFIKAHLDELRANLIAQNERVRSAESHLDACRKDLSECEDRLKQTQEKRDRTIAIIGHLESGGKPTVPPSPFVQVINKLIAILG